MAKLKDITGQKFGYLTAIQPTNRRAGRNVIWLCQCDCGNTHSIPAGDLQRPRDNSCGCRRGTLEHGYAKRGKKHPLYKTWIGIRDRCNNPSNKRYHDYGGRGIKLRDPWNEPTVFINGILTSIGDRPPGMSLDRINNDGDYEPGNVKWSTHSEQMKNRRPRKEWRHTLAQFTTAELEAEIARRQLA
jgi:hypothetical protein